MENNSEKELPKHYDPALFEDGLYQRWEAAGAFAPQDSRSGETFSIVMPPPNVTGQLHIGHAFEHSLQDIAVRFHRMLGDRTLWIPGTDHAAIATQAKYEKELYKREKKSRHDFPRKEFFDQVQAFALNNRERILSQVKKLGDSVDWSRLAFTLDEPRERAVQTAFKRMYDDGLIYRGYRIVNWDPKGQTTIADDEIVHEETMSSLYTFRYTKDFPIPIATTRPETKLGDVAVAVHPDDARYQDYVDQTFKVDFIGVPLTIKVIADSMVDPSFGTGAVGVTPAHSMVDWELAERHKLSFKPVINEYAKIEGVSAEFDGKKVGEARELVVEKLRAAGLIEREEQITNNLSKSDRTGGIIEPLPKLQWFVDVDKPFTISHSKIPGISSGATTTLQEIMRTTVASGATTIVPEHFERIYMHWVDNLRDWCVSRQILYGHRIPVWYCSTSCSPIVSTEQPVACPKCGSTQLEQDPDTLDTWFSSALWTFSTLGWPDEMEDLQNFHPTTFMNPGYEILTLWVSRIVLMSGYLLGEIPFRHVSIHGMVRDKDGRKFSKSLNNGVDPLEVIQEYGADALRMGLIVGVAPGSDAKFDMDRVKGYKHFANKVWNIARFVQIRSEGLAMPQPFNALNPETAADREIVAKLKETIVGMTDEMNRYQLHLAAERIYQFIWHEFADVYIESSKSQLDDAATSETTRQLLNAVLRTGLTLLHPFMPFVTEAIWQSLPKPEGASDLLILEAWPKVEAK